MVTLTAQDKFVKANGLRIHYLDWGNQNLPAIVMLHGTRSYAHVWDEVASKFADRYRILAVDQRGRGDSDWSPNAEYYVDNYVSDLEQLVDSVGVESFILMGHSVGGVVTMVYSARHPEMVKAAVIEDMGPRPDTPNTGADRQRRSFDSTPLEFATWEEAAAYWRNDRPMISDEALKLRVGYTMKQQSNGKITWKYDFRGIRKSLDKAMQIDQWPHIRNIKCPTLLICGEVSNLTSRETAAAMVAANPNIRTVEIPGASHTVHEEQPDAFNRELDKFLSSLK